MKARSYASCILAALLSAASLSAAPKEKPAKAPLLLVIPGEPGRPYTVIDNVAGVFEVTYRGTFTNGSGGQDSYPEDLGEAFDQVRATAKKNGADAVIHAQFDFVPFADSVIQDEVQLRKARVIGLIKVFGTQVKFLPEPAPKPTEGSVEKGG